MKDKWNNKVSMVRIVYQSKIHEGIVSSCKKLLKEILMMFQVMWVVCSMSYLKFWSFLEICIENQI